MKTKYGGTPLHWAADGGHAKTCELLLDGRADLGATNVLLSAASKGGGEKRSTISARDP